MGKSGDRSTRRRIEYAIKVARYDWFVKMDRRMLRYRLLFHWPVNSGKVTRAVDDPHYLNAAGNQPIQRKPAVNDKRPCISGDLRPRTAKPGVLRQQMAGLFDAVINPVRDGFGIARRNIDPDAEQVFARLARVNNLAHALTLSRRGARGLPASMR